LNIQFELDRAIEQEEQLKATPDERSGGIDVSGSLKCHRMRYLKYYGAPGKDIDARGLRTFLMGRVVEKVLVTYLRFRGIIKRKGQYIKHYLDPRIRGKTDFTVMKNSKVYVAELKSYDGFSFWKRKKEPEKLNILHEAQALNYVDILTHQGEKIEPEALIVEISRDNLNVIESLTRPIDQVREELHSDWKRLIKAIDEKKVPDVLPTFPSGYECKYCTVKETCKEIHAQDKKEALSTKSSDSKDSNNTKQPKKERSKVKSN